MIMFGLRSLALALSLCQASAFAGVVSAAGGAFSSKAGGGARALGAATPPWGMDAGDQHLGVVRRARGGGVFRRHAASVPGVDNGDIVVDTPSPPPKDGLLAAYLRALDRKPIFTKVVTSGVICGVGDIMAQALAYKKATIGSMTLGAFLSALEFKRFAIYAVLGALWIAPVVHYWFDALDATIKEKKQVAGEPAPSFATKMLRALKMVTLDQTIGAPIVNAGFMFLFAFATALTSGSGGVAAGKRATNMLKSNIVGTMIVCWKLWPVANLINFAFVPAKLRVLFMNFVGLGWNIYLSAAVN